MSTTTQSVENGTDSDRRIDHARFVRACTQTMTVTTLAPNMKTVEHDGESYDTDLVNVVCECPDCQYRNVICKHLLRAAVVTIYTDGTTTQFVARVARFATTHACPAGNHRLCSGPTGPEFPCPQCVAATAADEWAIWQQTAGRTGARR
jgi:predicted RNA-binding Zn-ribbon protein involved in translation (DUF1610 family)